MAIVEVSVLPIGTKSTSVSSYVAKAERVLRQQKDVKYQLTPMATVLEGDLDVILSLVRKMHETVFSDEIKRVLTMIKIDDRRDKPSTMEGKVKSVEQKL